jgi:hypothetical protein
MTKLDRESTTNDSGFDSLTHLVCTCNEDLSLCGTELNGAFKEGGDEDCVVCIDLAEIPCKNCGN